MDRDDILRIVQGETVLIGADEVTALERRYPYFPIPTLLLLKQNPPRPGQTTSHLQRAAIYASDRTSLYTLLYGVRPQAEELYPDAHPQTGDTTLSAIDRFLSTYAAGASSDLSDLPVIASLDYLSVTDDTPIPDTQPDEEDRRIDSFLDALANGSLGKAAAPAEKPESVPDYSFEDEAGNEEEDPFLTESLAKIYIKQRRYSKALEIIKKLSLKYPKKNAYFADQIRFLEKLIINAKSK